MRYIKVAFRCIIQHGTRERKPVLIAVRFAANCGTIPSANKKTRIFPSLDDRKSTREQSLTIRFFRRLPCPKIAPWLYAGTDGMLTKPLTKCSRLRIHLPQKETTTNDDESLLFAPPPTPYSSSTTKPNQRKSPFPALTRLSFSLRRRPLRPSEAMKDMRNTSNIASFLLSVRSPQAIPPNSSRSYGPTYPKRDNLPNLRCSIHGAPASSHLPATLDRPTRLVYMSHHL